MRNGMHGIVEDKSPRKILKEMIKNYGGTTYRELDKGLDQALKELRKWVLGKKKEGNIYKRNKSGFPLEYISGDEAHNYNRALDDLAKELK